MDNGPGVAFHQDDIENDPTFNGISCKIYINRTNLYSEYK
jgi:hypothetical protein